MVAAKTDTTTRRRQIAQAALSLVASAGMEALSVARIARHVGIVPSAIYRHFPDKDAVLDEVIELIEAMLTENVRAVERETEDPVEQLRRLLMRHTQLIRENRGIPRVVFSQDVYGGSPGRRTRMYEVIAGYLAKVSAIIADAQNRGCIHREVDPSAMAVVYLGLVQTPAVLWHLSNGEFDITGQARKAWDMMAQVLVV
jgi:AcrR family transcriptional regulator